MADFISKHKKEEIRKATIRFETNPGLQAQVDWKEDMTLINSQGEVFKINIFLTVLGYLRLKFLKLTTDRNQDTLFRCMSEAFEYFRRTPRDILFDNMKTVVDHSKSSFAKTVFNETFRRFAADAGFEPVACMPYRPQTKGKVEALARLTERLRAYNEEFETWEELEAIVNEFVNDINNEVSQGTGEVPFERFKKENEYLLPKPNMGLLSSYFSRQEEKTYLVSRESMIKFEGRKYSVPTRYIGERLTAFKDENDNLNIYYSGQLVVRHAIGTKMYNYTVETAVEILKSDSMGNYTYEEIHDFIYESLSKMDIYIGGL